MKGAKIHNCFKLSTFFFKQGSTYWPLQGPKLTFLAGTNWRPKFFLQLPNGKMWSPKVSVKLFLCDETQAKIIGRQGLAGKIFAIDVVRYQTSAEIIF